MWLRERASDSDSSHTALLMPSMTGGFDVPLVDEVGDTGARWAGTAHILGPRWARLPLMSLGL